MQSRLFDDFKPMRLKLLNMELTFVLFGYLAESSAAVKCFLAIVSSI